jgi:hypothetical protein
MDLTYASKSIEFLELTLNDKAKKRTKSKSSRTNVTTAGGWQHFVRISILISHFVKAVAIFTPQLIAKSTYHISVNCKEHRN